ncbi:MAG: hypothetical protein LBT47_10580 [Deltaproteobacteria bacterium]|jgi:hypothetical protein|nr:hypothetical protein [Deltaproteobacteria bacterium]
MEIKLCWSKISGPSPNAGRPKTALNNRLRPKGQAGAAVEPNNTSGRNLRPQPRIRAGRKASWLGQTAKPADFYLLIIGLVLACLTAGCSPEPAATGVVGRKEVTQSAAKDDLAAGKSQAVRSGLGQASEISDSLKTSEEPPGAWPDYGVREIGGGLATPLAEHGRRPVLTLSPAVLEPWSQMAVTVTATDGQKPLSSASISFLENPFFPNIKTGPST